MMKLMIYLNKKNNMKKEYMNQGEEIYKKQHLMEWKVLNYLVIINLNYNIYKFIIICIKFLILIYTVYQDFLDINILEPLKIYQVLENYFKKKNLSHKKGKCQQMFIKKLTLIIIQVKIK